MRTIAKIFLAATLFSTSFARASFEENAHRYMSGQDILWSLSVFFDFSKNSGNTSICTGLQELNSTLAGGNSPITGEPISPSPTQGTVLWITGCIETYFSQPSVITGDTVRGKRLLGEEFYKNTTNDMLMKPWSDIPEDLRRTLIRHMVSAFLGSDEVIKDFGFIQNPDDFRERLFLAAHDRTGASTLEIITLLSMNLSVRDEFLSY